MKALKHMNHLLRSSHWLQFDVKTWSLGHTEEIETAVPHRYGRNNDDYILKLNY
jgi:hypothetical protein